MKTYSFEIGSRKFNKHQEGGDYDIGFVFIEKPSFTFFRKQFMMKKLEYKDVLLDISPICIETIAEKISIQIPSYLNILAQSNITQTEIDFDLPKLSNDQIYHGATLSILLQAFKLKNENKTVVDDKTLKRFLWLSTLHVHQENINFCLCFDEGEKLYKAFQDKENRNLKNWIVLLEKRLSELVGYLEGKSTSYSHVDHYYLKVLDFLNIPSEVPNQIDYTEVAKLSIKYFKS